eukprot:690912_1
MTALAASDLIPQLDKLWAIPESEREKGIKLLNKIYSNILNNPSNPKFRDLNFSKIRAKLDKCRPAFYLLFTAGFTQNMDGTRLQWENNQITMKKLQNANTALQAQIKGEDLDSIGNEYGNVINPDQTSLITNRNMNIHRAKKEKQKLEQLQKEAEAQQLKDDVERIETMETDNNEDGVDDDEMRKAMAMSMDNEDGKDTANDVNMTDKTTSEDKGNASVDDGLSAEDRALIDQIRAAKGVHTTLKASDLKGLTAEEKKAKMKALRDKFRKEKKQSAMRAKIAKQKARRANIHANQDAERKRKEKQLQQLARQKKKEKEFAKKQHARVMAKIQAQKEERKRQAEFKKKKEEAAKKAKAQQQNQ